MELLKCSQCGGQEFSIKGMRAVCRHCGATYILSEEEQEYSKGQYYIELARIAEETGSKKIIKYSEKAIQHAPADAEAWHYRISALLHDQYSENVDWDVLKKMVAEAAVKAVQLAMLDQNKEWVLHEDFAVLLTLAEADDLESAEWMESLSACIRSVSDRLLSEDEISRKKKALARLRPTDENDHERS